MRMNKVLLNEILDYLELFNIIARHFEYNLDRLP